MFDLSTSLEPAKPLQQHVNFVAAVNAAGGCARTSGTSDSVLLHRKVMGLPVTMFPRLTDSADLLTDTKHFLKSAGLSRHLLLISPDSPCPELHHLGALPLMTPATVAELDLTGSPMDRRRAMHKKWRNRLAKGEQAGLRVTIAPLPTDHVHRLLAQDQVQAAARNYKNWPHGLTMAYAAANPGQAMLFTASQSRTRMAEVLILIHGNSATYHIGHIGPAGKALCAHNLLMDHAATWLAERSVARLDLGIIDTKNAAGLARFKLGMGARARRLGGTWGWWPPTGRSMALISRLDRKKMSAGLLPQGHVQQRPMRG